MQDAQYAGACFLPDDFCENQAHLLYVRKHVVFKNVLSRTLDCELHEGSDYDFVDHEIHLQRPAPGTQ